MASRPPTDDAPVDDAAGEAYDKVARLLSLARDSVHRTTSLAHRSTSHSVHRTTSHSVHRGGRGSTIDARARSRPRMDSLPSPREPAHAPPGTPHAPHAPPEPGAPSGEARSSPGSGASSSTQSAPTAQAFGAGKHGEVRAILWRALLLSSLISVSLLAMQLPIIDVALWMVPASIEAETHARTKLIR